MSSEKLLGLTVAPSEHGMYILHTTVRYALYMYIQRTCDCIYNGCPLYIQRSNIYVHRMSLHIPENIQLHIQMTYNCMAKTNICM